MRISLVPNVRVRVYTLVCLSTASVICTAQQKVTPTDQQTRTLTDSVTGEYAYSFVPANQEPITGTVKIVSKAGRYYGVFTSPKLSAPLDADSVGVAGNQVFASAFNGQFTFEFRVIGSRITDAVFTKTVNGQTERGSLSIRRSETK